jgi:hypothetical protein
VLKAEFVTDKLWKASRAVCRDKRDGWERLQCILDSNGKAVISTEDHDGTKYTRSDDMKLRVCAVIAAIGRKRPLSIYNNDFMRMYLSSLNSYHSPPYRRERNRIVSVIMHYAMLEFSKIVSERRLVLGEGFVSVCTDFWKDPHRKEDYGALVANLIVLEYYVEAWNRSFFMSKDTASRLGISLVGMQAPKEIGLCLSGPQPKIHLPFYGPR